jgi:vitamin B12 transporter
LVYYNRVIKDGLDYDYTQWNYYNILQQNVNGIELESKWNVNARNIIQANYTFMSGNEISQNRVTTVEFITYPYLLKRPKNLLNIQWQHQFNEKWSMQITGKYIDKRYDIGGYMQPDVTLNYYTNLNLHINYKASKHLQLFFDGQNLGNDHFQEIYGYNAIGRKWLVGLNWQR